MQTFVPLLTLPDCARVLDTARLGKQRVEAQQIEDAILSGSGWTWHPAVLMWHDYVPFLRQYRRYMIEEWCRRGYANSMPVPRLDTRVEIPHWWGGPIHLSHRRALMHKNPEHYARYFHCRAELDYVWPT